MISVTIGSRMNNHVALTVQGFTNTFIVARIHIARYQVYHIGIFDQRTRCMIAEGKSTLKAVGKLLMFLADKEQNDLDTFIELSK